MTLLREQVKGHLVEDMTVRFPARHGLFPESLKIASLGFPTDESRREWGKKVNQSPWFPGWFTPSEFLACVTFGKDPENDPTNKNPNLIDLMFATQSRPPESNALAMELFHAAASANPVPKSATRKKKRR
jgi:hypothetical protein